MKKYLFSAVLIVFLLFGVETVSACLCFSMLNPTPKQVRMQLKDGMERASFIFSGEVIRLDEFKVTFKVDEVWKGSALKEITMSTGKRENGNGTVTGTSCDYNFHPGKKYLVYAFGFGEEMQTYKCSGTGELENSEELIEFIKKTIPRKKVKKQP